MLNLAALIVACYMCRHDEMAFALLLVVGAVVFAPVNPDWFSAVGWYSLIVMAELSVISFAVLMNTDATNGIIFTGAALISCHLFEMGTTPFAGEKSYYQETVSGIEFAQLLILSVTKIKAEGVYDGIGAS